MSRKIECAGGISGKGSQLLTGQALGSYKSALQNSEVMLQLSYHLLLINSCGRRFSAADLSTN